MDELNEVPLMAMMFWLMVWHAQRRLDADHERDLVSDENARLLATQRRFLQDASHQLRTPITIALGHAELLARNSPTGPSGGISRWWWVSSPGCGGWASGCWSSPPPRTRTSSARADRPGPVHDGRHPALAADRDRQWQLGRLDAVTIGADRERLGLAVDALLENAVRHTGSGDTIQLSVLVTRAGPAGAYDRRGHRPGDRAQRTRAHLRPFPDRVRRPAEPPAPAAAARSPPPRAKGTGRAWPWSGR